MVEQQVQNPQYSQNQNFIHPAQMQDLAQVMNGLLRFLQEATNQLVVIRRELRGEAIFQNPDGSNQWIQVTKPFFIKINFETNEPFMEKKTMPWGEDKMCYVPSDEAIEEILSMLKFAGLNQVTPIAGIDEDNYLEDLKEFECKLAGVLALKQKEWGIDKELLPMLQFKLKTIVQDARSYALEGRALKAIQTSVQEIKQSIEGVDMKKKMSQSTPY